MTYYADSDSSGNIIGYYTDLLDYPDGIPKTAIPLTDSQWFDSHTNQGKYIIKNGQLVEFIIPDATQFENAQNQKIIEVENGYAQTIASGFQFAIGSSTYTMGWRQDAVYNDQLHLSMTQMAINEGVEKFPVDYADINGNVVVIPDQTTLTDLDSTANSFAWNNLKQLRTTIANIKAHKLSDYADLQEALDAINSITWTPATY